jgi:hypothetical protein
LLRSPASTREDSLAKPSTIVAIALISIAQPDYKAARNAARHF